MHGVSPRVHSIPECRLPDFPDDQAMRRVAAALDGIPPSWRDDAVLTHLEVPALRRSRCAAIPEGLATLPAPRSRDLSGNRIAGSLPDLLWGLPLEELLPAAARRSGKGEVKSLC